MTKKIEGIIIQARTQLHEYEEKNSKYFLNREEGKKHIRKLYITGVISTDPLSIMKLQNQILH